MPSGRTAWLLLVSLLPPAAAWGLDTVQAPTASETLYLTAVPGLACVESAAGGRDCFTLPAGVEMRALMPTADGWVAAGTAHLRSEEELFVVARRAGALHVLPLPPRATPHRRRGHPALFAAGGRLDGIAWLEGASQGALGLWSARWLGAGWGVAEPVAAPGAGSQLAPTAAVLADGRWLLAWAAHDGEDDEILWSLRGKTDWSDPRRLHLDNQVPDVRPAVVAVGGGALAAWSRFDGVDYRVVTARLEGDRWRELEVQPGRGGLRAAFTTLDAGLQLVHRSVAPGAWSLVELSRSGEVVARRDVPSDRFDRPVVWAIDGGLSLAWPPPPDGIAAPVPAPPRPRADALGGDAFRYMAFGDSITAGLPQHDECGMEGYPGRIPDLLPCHPPDCEVVNEGLGGEDTGDGVTRIHDLLEDEGPWDIVILMEGTNDICFREVSNETVEFNLRTMDEDATAHAADTLHASIIHFHPDNQTHGTSKDGLVADMRDRVRDELAHLDVDIDHLWWADPWTPLCPGDSCFDAHYTETPPDPVGHPDCSGYDILADVMRDAIQGRAVPEGVDAVEPQGTTSDTTPTFRWNKEIPRDATWYQFQLDGPGGNLEDLWMTEETCAPWQCTLDLGALAEGTYTWRVRGRNPAGRSPWVETTFTIQTVFPPGAPTPLAPEGAIGDERPAFSWLRESPLAADRYQLEVSDEAGVVLDQTFLAGLACTATTCTVDPFTEGDPLAAGDYSWRVRGSNVAGSGPWSHTLAFTLIPGLVFADGFETGNTDAWSQVQP